MGWESILIGLAFGSGLLLIYDALVRPDATPDPRKWLKKIGPRGTGAVSGATAAWLFTGWVTAALSGAILGWFLPTMISSTRQEKERLRRIEGVADLAARLRDAIRSGIGIYDALSQAAANPPSAIAADLKRLSADARVSGLGPAAEAFGARLWREGELLAAALALGDEAGASNTSDVLDALAEAASSRAATIREARARQTRAKVSARVVAAVPVVLLLLIKKSNPSYLAPFDSAQGQVILAFALCLIAGGYLAMLRVSRIDGGTR